MKILLLNAPNTLNYGSMMLAENFISYFDPERCHQFLVETGTPEETAGRLREATGRSDISALTGLWERKELCGRARMLAGFLFPKRVTLDADLIVVLGGDDFTEDHGWRALVSQLLRLNLLAPPICFVGQSMGPFFSFRKPLCKRLLSRADRILLRDSLSFESMGALGLRNIDKMPDLAFAPLYREEQPSAGDQKTALFFPSELIWRFSPECDREQCIRFYEDVLTLLAKRYQSVSVLPHVLRPEGSDDRKMVLELSGRVELPNVCFDTDEKMPYEIRSLIGAADVVVTGRMHPAVSAVSCGTPVIAFAYSEKYHGVIARDCQLEPYVLDVRKSPFNALSTAFSLALEKLEKEQEPLRKRLRALGEEKRKGVVQAMEELRTWYRS